MGIFSFLAGNRTRDDRDDAAVAPAAPRDAGPPMGPVAPEPGDGIPDVEPPGRDPSATAPNGEPRGSGRRATADWWHASSPEAGRGRIDEQSAEPAPGAPGTDQVERGGPGAADESAERDDAGGMWNFGAFLEPPAAPPETADAIARVGPSDSLKTLELKPKIVDALCTIFDPEIPVNIYELGLIYEVVVDANARVLIRMTLTSPACPSAQQLPSEVQYKVKAVPGVAEAAVDVVWDPPWTKDMMSDAAKLALGIW